MNRRIDNVLSLLVGVFGLILVAAFMVLGVVWMVWCAVQLWQ